MDEAEKLCDRVAIIDQGKIIAARLTQGTDRPHRAVSTHRRVRCSGGDSAPLDPESFASLPTVLAARREADGFCPHRGRLLMAPIPRGSSDPTWTVSTVPSHVSRPGKPASKMSSSP